MRILPLIAAGAALAATPVLAAAPAKAPAAAPAASGQKAPAEVEHAMLYLKVLIGGLQAENVEQPVKGALVGCLYNNSLGKISEAMDKLIAENPGKVSRDNPSQVLSAMLAVCGYKPGAAAGGAATPPAAKPAPSATPKATPTGR